VLVTAVATLVHHGAGSRGAATVVCHMDRTGTLVVSRLDDAVLIVSTDVARVLSAECVVNNDAGNWLEVEDIAPACIVLIDVGKEVACFEELIVLRLAGGGLNDVVELTIVKSDVVRLDR